MRNRLLLTVAILVLALACAGCGGGLKASLVKPYSDQLAVAVPVVVDEVLPLALEQVKDEAKRERIKKYGEMAKLAAAGIKTVVDAAAEAEKKP